MKQTRFTIHYRNGKVWVTYAMSYFDAVISAINHARESAWDYIIDSIVNEDNGNQIVDIGFDVDWREVA